MRRVRSLPLPWSSADERLALDGRTSSVFAQRVTLASVEGMIWPRTASTRLVWRIASSKLPTTPDIATMNRFPKEWPARPEPSEKRYWKSFVTSGSASASAAMQARTSPGGRTPSSRRRTPEEPPSSATVTMAVRLPVYSLRPRRSVREAGAAADRDDLRAAAQEALRVDGVHDAVRRGRGWGRAREISDSFSL